jgi:hypothetical protein
MRNENAEMALAEAKKEADLYEEYKKLKIPLWRHLLAAKEYPKAKKAFGEASGVAKPKAVEEAKMKAEAERML